MKLLNAIAVVLFLGALDGSVYAEGIEKMGEDLYKTKCSACHSFEFNGVGPSHQRVVGRPAGSVAGFPYSNAVKSLGIKWTEENLDRWLTDPEKFAPGQRMGVSVPNPEERKAIIAFLKHRSAQVQ